MHNNVQQLKTVEEEIEEGKEWSDILNFFTAIGVRNYGIVCFCVEKLYQSYDFKCVAKLHVSCSRKTRCKYYYFSTYFQN